MEKSKPDNYEELLRTHGVSPEEAKNYFTGIPEDRWDSFTDPKRGMFEASVYVRIARGSEKRLLGEVGMEIQEEWDQEKRNKNY